MATWKPSVCPLCASGCGLTVRVMDADADVVRDGQAGVVRIYAAKKLEGSAEHPGEPRRPVRARPGGDPGDVSPGSHHAAAEAHPASAATAEYQAISWDDAIAELVSRLDALGVGRHASRRWRSSGRRRAAIARARGAAVPRRGSARPAPVTYELFGDDVLRRANALSFGREQLPTFDLANARYVLSFGADFLGTWNSPVSQSRGYGAMRQGRPGIRGAFVQVESRMSQTGANADEWVPVQPGHRRRAGARPRARASWRPSCGAGRRAGRAGALIDGWSAGLA